MPTETPVPHSFSLTVRTGEVPEVMDCAAAIVPDPVAVRKDLRLQAPHVYASNAAPGERYRDSNDLFSWLSSPK